MNYQEIIDQIATEVSWQSDRGKQASYIPMLKEVPLDHFGMAIKMVDGTEYATGDAQVNFSAQSITKLLTLTLLTSHGFNILGNRLGVEPSGSAFNSLVQLEYESGIPRNPFINAGALVVTDALMSITANAAEDLLNYVKDRSENPDIEYDLKVKASEKEVGYRNYALAHLIKSFGNLEHEPEDILDVYFHHCSMYMSCLDLVRTFIFLANSGLDYKGVRVLSPSNVKRMNALMLTCGAYDASGTFAYRVGLPSKSGVGGGIIAVVPDKMCISVWSPGLDEYGNSVLGTLALEKFTTKTGFSIF